MSSQIWTGWTFCPITFFSVTVCNWPHFRILWGKFDLSRCVQHWSINYFKPCVLSKRIHCMVYRKAEGCSKRSCVWASHRYLWVLKNVSWKDWKLVSSYSHGKTVVVSIVLVLLDLCNSFIFSYHGNIGVHFYLNINKMLMIANLQCYVFSYYADGYSVKSWVRKGKLRDTSWCNGRPFDVTVFGSATATSDMSLRFL